MAQKCLVLTFAGIDGSRNIRSSKEVCNCHLQQDREVLRLCLSAMMAKEQIRLRTVAACQKPPAPLCQLHLLSLRHLLHSRLQQIKHFYRAGIVFSGWGYYKSLCLTLTLAFYSRAVRESRMTITYVQCNITDSYYIQWRLQVI